MKNKYNIPLHDGKGGCSTEILEEILKDQKKENRLKKLKKLKWI